MYLDGGRPHGTVRCRFPRRSLSGAIAGARFAAEARPQARLVDGDGEFAEVMGFLEDLSAFEEDESPASCAPP